MRTPERSLYDLSYVTDPEFYEIFLCSLSTRAQNALRIWNSGTAKRKTCPPTSLFELCIFCKSDLRWGIVGIGRSTLIEIESELIKYHLRLGDFAGAVKL